MIWVHQNKRVKASEKRHSGISYNKRAVLPRRNNWNKKQIFT